MNSAQVAQSPGPVDELTAVWGPGPGPGPVLVTLPVVGPVVVGPGPLLGPGPGPGPGPLLLWPAPPCPEGGSSTTTSPPQFDVAEATATAAEAINTGTSALPAAPRSSFASLESNPIHAAYSKSASPTRNEPIPDDACCRGFEFLWASRIVAARRASSAGRADEEVDPGRRAVHVVVEAGVLAGSVAGATGHARIEGGAVRVALACLMFRGARAGS